jgi:hypothetical protein
MNWRKVLFYTIFGLGLLVALQIALSVVAVVIGSRGRLPPPSPRWLSRGAVLRGFKLVSWYRDGGATARPRRHSQRSIGTEPPTRVESLKERYANGHLSEAEFERELERELDGPDVDAIDRELSRERE